MPRDERSLLSGWMHEAAERRERMRGMDGDLDWRSWVRLRLAAYWYWAIVLFLDLGIFATILSLFGRPAGALAYVAGIAFVIPAIYLEYEGYRLLWPRDEEMLARDAEGPPASPAPPNPRPDDRASVEQKRQT